MTGKQVFQGLIEVKTEQLKPLSYRIIFCIIGILRACGSDLCPSHEARDMIAYNSFIHFCFTRFAFNVISSGCWCITKPSPSCAFPSSYCNVYYFNPILFYLSFKIFIHKPLNWFCGSLKGPIHNLKNTVLRQHCSKYRLEPPATESLER